MDEVPKLIRVPVGDFVWTFFYKTNMNIVDEDGWILEFGAENDTK